MGQYRIDLEVTHTAPVNLGEDCLSDYSSVHCQMDKTEELPIKIQYMMYMESSMQRDKHSLILMPLWDKCGAV